jgi:hypothetical protein
MWALWGACGQRRILKNEKFFIFFSGSDLIWTRRAFPKAYAVLGMSSYF